MRAHCLVLFIILACSTAPVFAQDTLQVSSRYIEVVDATATHLNQQLSKRSQKVIGQSQKQETRIRRKLEKIDSVRAQQLFSATQQSLNKFGSAHTYIPSLDTLSGTIGFLSTHSSLLAPAKETAKKLQQTTLHLNELNEQFHKAQSVQQYLNERRTYLKEQLSQLGFARQLKKLNKQAYYYGQQVAEYKAMLKDHKKAERKAIDLLSRTKMFNDFMRKHSQFALLFRQSDPNNPLATASAGNLQTRTQLNTLVQQQIAAGGPNAQAQFLQNTQSAQSQLNQLKERMQLLGANTTTAMPEGFKPNDQKTKTFWQRLQYGLNLQSQKATNFFPTTTDIGLSMGYKLNDRSVIGIGASYKLGWGRSWNQVRVTSEGMSLRSFVDWKIKGGLWLSGGYEQHYRTAFNHIAQLKEQSAWQQSGLLGLSKVISLKTKFFSQTKLQLFWDMLSYRQIPKSQPIVFRVGYNLK